jgi:predicted Rossmann-fold nucleotide-binding protein
MKLKIGVMGHAGSDLPEKEAKLAFELGKAIAEQDAVLITGFHQKSPGRPGIDKGIIRHP